jgi:hypothetical protein
MANNIMPGEWDWQRTGQFPLPRQQQPIPQPTNGGFLGKLDQLGAALAPFAQQAQKRNDDEVFRKVMGINPQFGQQLYGTQIARDKQEQENQKRSALAALARTVPGMDKTSALQKYAEIDPEGGLQALLGIGGNSLPAAIQEYQYLQGLTPAQKQEWYNNKRAAQVVNLGGTQAVLSGTDPTQLAEQFPVTLKPGEQPVVRGQQAEASAVGAAVGAASGAQKKKEINAPDIINLVQEAKKILPKATSGGAESLVKAGAQFAGISTDASKADRQLNIIGTRLTNYVPRFEGPQSDADVQTYKDAAGAVADTSLPYEDRAAALDTIEMLEKKYNGGASKIPPVSNRQLIGTAPYAPALPPSLPSSNLGWTVEEVK